MKKEKCQQYSYTNTFGKTFVNLKYFYLSFIGVIFEIKLFGMNHFIKRLIFRHFNFKLEVFSKKGGNISTKNKKIKKLDGFNWKI